MDALLSVAAERALTLEDTGLSATATPEMVRAKCDALAAALVRAYMAGAIDWPRAATIANHFFNLMVQHCGERVPDYAWDVYLAFDESEIDGRGDPYARSRIVEVIRKYGAA